MNYLLTLFLISFLLILPQHQKIHIVGRWSGEDQNEIGSIIFEEDGYAAFEIQGQILGGKEFYMSGEKGKMTYSINYETTPIEVDFTLTKVESGESKQILAILEFENDNTLNFNLSFDGPRPSEFDDNSIVLTRSK